MSPGIAPSGLFWTVRIPDGWVSVDADDLDDGARYRIEKLHLLDYGKLANSLPAFLPPGTAQTPPDAAVASFDMRWMGNVAPANGIDSGSNRFTYEGIFKHATRTSSSTVPSQHFKFQTPAAITSPQTFTALGND